MKRVYLFAFTVLALCLMPGCKQEEIVFDYERIHFETKADAMLLEVVVPTSTQATDEIYVAGAFTGGDEAAMKNNKFRLTPHPETNAKWGVYLYPADFKDGYTPADGFHFISKLQREERTLKNDTVVRYDNPQPGTRTELTVMRWAAYFDKVENPEDITHDGYVIYVENQTGWAEIALYAWGDGLPELFGAWPGVLPSGNIEKNGKRYIWFDTGAANEGLTYNLIFNNNNNGEQYPRDGEPSFPVTLDKDYYLTVTATGIEEQGQEVTITHDGYVVYALNQTGWEEGFALYTYKGGDNGEDNLHGGWPGMQPTGTVTIKGHEFVYFDMGAANEGKTQSLIFNNNGNGKQTPSPDYVYTIDHDVYLAVSAGGISELDIDNLTVPDPEPEPESQPVVDPREDPEAKEYKILVDNQTGWEAIAVYAYGTNLVEIFGGWPGQQLTEKETVGGMEYLVAKIKGNTQQYNLIFNNNGAGTQLDEIAYMIDHDAVFRVTAEGVTEVTPAD
ncbi:MAG: starch-binding protein [Paludibacteraceae bacterium]|nr:starch-binding protein [Paludibacteraceae bacterium]